MKPAEHPSWKSKFRKHRTLYWILGISIIVIILLLLFTNIYFYVNLLLGNDLLTTLNADQEFFSLTRNQEAQAQFSLSAVTSPFCKVQCSSYFMDISANKTLAEENFSLNPGIISKKSYPLTVPALGHGQLLYRYKVLCYGEATFFCHTDITSNQPQERSILITVNYNLSEEENRLKLQDKENILNLTALWNNLELQQQQSKFWWQELSPILSEPNFEAEITLIGEEINSESESLKNLENIWNTENYTRLDDNQKVVANHLDEIAQKQNLLVENITSLLNSYNQLVTTSNKLQEQAQALINTNLTANNITLEIIQKFNHSLSLLTDLTTILTVKNTLSSKEQFILEAEQSLNETTLAIQKEEKKQSQQILESISSKAKNLCSLTNYCWEGLPYLNLTHNVSPIVADSCKKLEEFRNYTFFINNTDLDNSTAAIITSTLTELIPPCTYAAFPTINITFLLPIMINITPTQNLTLLDVTLPEPPSQCCVFGKCQDCCEDISCRDQNYPVLFVHGHAFNKDTSFEYSLDAFNKIQDQLEKDGLLDAGSVSIYSISGANTFNLNSQLSLKASYYVDFFQKESNYVPVQTKSENIDTYAVRFKEIIDRTLQKTGRTKVTIVAHSMGGLVVRRYVQLFGENNVDKIIFIGTPQSGITGSVYSYCDIIGEKLECDDMQENSLFLNKLNRGSALNIPIYNIIGSGCDMDGKDGDGVVLVEKAKLLGAETLVINGTCDGLDVLHTSLLDIEKYPRVYEVLKGILER